MQPFAKSYARVNAPGRLLFSERRIGAAGRIITCDCTDFTWRDPSARLGRRLRDRLFRRGSFARGDDRTFDGAGNNMLHPTFGMAGGGVMRLSPDGYGDGASSMGGATRPNPRLISNVVVRQTSSIPNNRNLSDWVWQWGQFLDHDMTLMPEAEPLEPQDIPVPPGDPVFGFPSIPFNRTGYVAGTGSSPANPRVQVNVNTSFLDGSMIYGSDSVTANSLRTSGGRMLTSAARTGHCYQSMGTATSWPAIFASTSRAG